MFVERELLFFVDDIRNLRCAESQFLANLTVGVRGAGRGAASGGTDLEVSPCPAGHGNQVPSPSHVPAPECDQ